MNQNSRPVFGTRCPSACLLGVAVLVALTPLAGCKKPLLTPNEERSQYDRYDAIRGQRTSAYNYDEFGTRRPNLRGRLLSKE
jgi:hypothetical protein